MSYRFNVTLPRILAAGIDLIILNFIVMISQVFYRPFDFFDDGISEVSTLNTLNPLTDIEPSTIIISVFVMLLVGIILYVYVPYQKEGKTIGKMLMRIKAIDANGNPPNLGQHFLRAIMIYEFYLYVLIVWLVFIDMEVFILAEVTVLSITTLAIFFSLSMIIFSPDGAGFHDLLARTYVVDENYDPVLEKEVDPTQVNKDWAFEETEDKEDDFLKAYDDRNPWNER